MDKTNDTLLETGSLDNAITMIGRYFLLSCNWLHLNGKVASVEFILLRVVEMI